jgi:NADH-quinone oxidoreductase subunit M
MMGFATLSHDGMIGAGVQMFSHGVMTALFFAVVGMIYDQAHTRNIPELGGFRKVMPLVAGAFIVGGMVSMGMPGFSGFIAEFPIFMGVWQTYPWIAIVAAISIVITASYIIRIIGNVFFGNLPAEFEGHVHDVSVLDKVALVFLSGILILIGVFPSVMVPMVQSGVQNILRLLGGA